MTNPVEREVAANTEGYPVCCSFCRKDPARVGELIESPVLPGGTPAYICRECVELCLSIFEQAEHFGGAEKQAAVTPMLQAKIDQQLSILSSLEEDIIKLRYGLGDGYSYSFEEIGEKLGMVPTRVAEIAANALTKLTWTEPKT
jgi:hypothetical protein